MSAGLKNSLVSSDFGCVSTVTVSLRPPVVPYLYIVYTCMHEANVQGIPASQLASYK